MLSATPYIFFPLAGLFVASHVVALETSLYWFLPWFDIVMHTWGGFLVVYGLNMFNALGSRRVQFAAVVQALILVLVMVVWEVFEFVFVIDLSQPHLVRDTIFDGIYGALGGVVGYLVVKK